MTRCINAILSRRRVIETSRFRRRRDVGGFGGIPFAFGASPFTTYGVNLGMVFGIEFALADCTLMDGFLHRFPLFLSDFEFVNAPDVVDVTIRHPRVHGHAAMRLERYATYTGHFACLGVEGAVRATRTTTFPKGNQQHFSTSSLRSMSQMDSPICSISRASMSASCCSDTYSPCLI